MDPDTSSLDVSIDQAFQPPVPSSSTCRPASPQPAPPSHATLSSTDFYTHYYSPHEQQGYRFPVQAAATSTTPSITYSSSPQDQSATPVHAWLSPQIASDVNAGYYSPPTIHLPHDASLAPPPMTRNLSAPPPHSDSWTYGYVPMPADYTTSFAAAGAWQKSAYVMSPLDEARLETSSLPDLPRKGVSPTPSPAAAGVPQLDSWLQAPTTHMHYGILQSPIQRHDSPSNSTVQSGASHADGVVNHNAYWMPNTLKPTPPSSTSSPKPTPAEAAKAKAAANKPKRKRMHVCETCKKDFNRPSALLLHTAVHTGEKTNVCYVNGCNRSFSNISNLRRHQRQLHAAECNVPLPATFSRRFAHTTPYPMPTPVGMAEARRQLFGML